MNCESMMMNLSELEMLDLWKLHHGYTMPRRDCAVEREDDAYLDALLLDEMRAWYANLLMTAPPELLPQEDVRADCSATYSADGGVKLELPARCVRVLAVRMNGWKRDATTVHEAGSAADMRQSVEWLRGTTEHPVAIADRGGTLRLYSVPKATKPAVEKVQCVVRPDDGSYRFAQSLLGSI
ncbi:MAG: hypothetical protein ACI4UN_07430 [Muribaculaceae bacterium]